MSARYLVPIALASVLGGCAGGGDSGAPVAPINGPVVPGTATIPVSVVIPPKPSSAAASQRAPQYVSPGTAAVAVYDGATVIYVGNFNAASNPQFTTVFAKTGATSVSAGTCVPLGSSSMCTVTITTTIGAHTFGVVTYPNSQGTQASGAQRVASDVGTVPAFSGKIVAEGELAVTLSPGNNPGQTITLLGVATTATFTGPSPALTQRLNGNGALVGIVGTTYSYQYVIADSATYQIVQPGNYDNGPVTIAETDGNAILTMTPISQAAPPASAGSQSFSVTCAKAGVATITASALNHPNATYASGLTYGSSNYAVATLGQTTLQCADNSATLPVTVQ